MQNRAAEPEIDRNGGYEVKRSDMGKYSDKFHEKFTAAAKEDCWLWQGSISCYGYGEFYAGATLKAHRISYCLFVGDVPAGMHVLHKCDTPACVNPSHLFLGTHLENQQDKFRKGRTAKGEMQGSSKLKAAEVVEIRRSYGEMSLRGLAKRYGVSHRTILRVCQKDTWAHI